MITSLQNRWVKDIRRLRRSKGGRSRDEPILLEGPHLVAEAVAMGMELEAVLATPEFLDSMPAKEQVSALPFPGLPFDALPIDDAVLRKVTDADSPRGVLAIARRPVTSLLDVPQVTGATYLFADGIQDPGNLGALSRVAEATGVAAMALSPGGCSPFHPRALRASAGSLLRLPVVYASAEDWAEHLASLQPTWLSLQPRDGVDLYAMNLPSTTVLILGSEGPGISPALGRRADQGVTIPMAGNVESLNVTVAAAIVLSEWRRRRGSLRVESAL